MYWREYFRELRLNSWALSFRGGCNIRWGWKVIIFVPRIVNNIKYMIRFKDAMYFAWQVQYLLNFKGDFTCSAHWKWPLICDTDYWWHWFLWQVKYLVRLEDDFAWQVEQTNRFLFREFPFKFWASRFSGRRSTWWVSEVIFFCSVYLK